MIDQTAPYPLLLAAYLLPILVCLLFFVRSNVKLDSRQTIFRLAMLWSVICLVIQVVFLGLPHHWSTLSLAGKLLAQLVGNLIVFAVSGWAMFVDRRRELPPSRFVISSSSFGVLVGVLVILPSILATMYLTCMLTGDCP